MSDYQPVPVHAAKQVATAFDKSIVAIVSWDPAFGLVHTTTYGRGPEDKLGAARLGEILATAAGCDLSKARMYEDFRVVDTAKNRHDIEVLTDQRDEAAKQLIYLMALMEELADGNVEWVAPGKTTFEALWAVVEQLGHGADLLAKFPQYAGGVDHGT